MSTYLKHVALKSMQKPQWRSTLLRCRMPFCCNTLIIKFRKPNSLEFIKIVCTKSSQQIVTFKSFEYSWIDWCDEAVSFWCDLSPRCCMFLILYSMTSCIKWIICSNAALHISTNKLLICWFIVTNSIARIQEPKIADEDQIKCFLVHWFDICLICNEKVH